MTSADDKPKKPRARRKTDEEIRETRCAALKRYRERHPDRMAAMREMWRDQHKEHCSDYFKEYYNKNKARINERCRDYNRTHKKQRPTALVEILDITIEMNAPCDGCGAIVKDLTVCRIDGKPAMICSNCLTGDVAGADK